MIIPENNPTTTLTPEQEEMALYEKAVAIRGKNETIKDAMDSMSGLALALSKYLRDGESPALTEQIQMARANMEVSMNLLHVIFGDCSEYECFVLDELRSVVNAF